MNNNYPRTVMSCMNISVISLFLLFNTLDRAVYATTASEINNLSKDTVETGVETQNIHAMWVKEKHQLHEEIDDLEHQLNHLKWQRRKVYVYRQGLDEKIAGLRIKATTMEAVSMSLLPVLEENLNKLTETLATDLPGNLQDRRKSLLHVQNVLNDYDMGLLDKTRAVLDAVAREVDLGHRVNVREDQIEIDGSAQRVKILQVGRTGLYALSLDCKKAYRWNKESSGWVSIKNNITAIHEAIEMAEGVRLIGLSRLPMVPPAKLQMQEVLQK